MLTLQIAGVVFHNQRRMIIDMRMIVPAMAMIVIEIVAMIVAMIVVMVTSGV